MLVLDFFYLFIFFKQKKQKGIVVHLGSRLVPGTEL